MEARVARSAVVGAGVRTSSAILCIFGLVWWLAAAGAVGGRWSLVLAPAGALVAMILFWHIRRIPNRPPARPARTMRIFGAINLVQAGLILGAAVVLGRLGHQAFIPGVVALVVGAHFVPFSGLFEWGGYRVLGVVGMAIGGLGVVVAGVTADVDVALRTVGAPFGVALWGAVFFLLVAVRSATP